MHFFHVFIAQEEWELGLNSVYVMENLTSVLVVQVMQNYVRKCKYYKMSSKKKKYYLKKQKNKKKQKQNKLENICIGHLHSYNVHIDYMYH
jgi:pyrroloquinoline quinone (PQQ) biosynthesis protein C